MTLTMRHGMVNAGAVFDVLGGFADIETIKRAFAAFAVEDGVDFVPRQTRAKGDRLGGKSTAAMLENLLHIKMYGLCAFALNLAVLDIGPRTQNDFGHSICKR